MVLLLGILFIMSTQFMLIISVMMLIVLFYSLYIYFVMSSFWLSYLLILIMLSGILVLFTYMVSIFPNEKFEFHSLIMLFLLFLGLYFYNDMDEFIKEVSIDSSKIWEGYSLWSSVYLVSILLSVMIMVVWMSNKSEGLMEML